MGRPLPPQFAARAAAGVEPAPELRVEALEVTQVIQDLAQSVPLIADKPTIVRVYLSVPPGTPPIIVRGELSANAADGAVQRIVSINESKVAALPPAGVRTLREELRLSLNFRVPAELLASGNVTFQLASLITIFGANAAFSPAIKVTVTFHEMPPLRVKIIGLRYRTGTPPSSHEPTERDYLLTLSWLRRAYPVSTVISTRTVLDSPDTWPFSCRKANAFLATVRRQDMSSGGDARTHYYGLVSDAAGFMRGCASEIPDQPSPDTVASGPAGAADFGWDGDGSYADWYTAHELGHTFGRFHPGFCDGNSDDDPAFPFANGQLANNDGSFVGFDIGDEALGLPMAALPGTTWHDVMTYCERQWLCAYTFGGIRERLMNEDTEFGGTGQPSGPVAAFAERAMLPQATQRLVNVVALVNLDDGTAEIRSVQPVERGRPSRPSPESDAILEILDTAGATLVAQSIRVKVSTCSEGDEKREGMIDAILPAPEGARQVRLIFRGQEAARFLPGSDPSGGPVVALGVAPAAGALRYIVQASRDGGETWETVATDLPAPDFTVARRAFAGVSRVQVRALETDGFNARVTTTQEMDITE